MKGMIPGDMYPDGTGSTLALSPAGKEKEVCQM